jgi:hypothetical protein
VAGPENDFEAQARGSAENGSPFTAELCRAIPDAMGESDFARRIHDWPGAAGPDALALRACGGLHALVLTGAAPYLAAFYPPAPMNRAGLRAALGDAIAEHDAFLTAYLDNPPQTNEVGRSSMLLGAALHVARATGLPLETYEIGASAGLNLWFSRYGFDLGNGLDWGRADAPLRIASAWSGAAPPLDQALAVVAQKGCDQNPLDPKSPDQRLRLLSYIWPDQPERLIRMREALDFAAARPAVVEKAEAADWVERQLRALAAPGIARMLYHTIVWQYLPEASKARILAALAEAGAAATEQTPLAWFRFENDMAGDGGLMELTLWPGGETRVLGRAAFHGHWVKWV